MSGRSVMLFEEGQIVIISLMIYLWQDHTDDGGGDDVG